MIIAARPSSLKKQKQQLQQHNGTPQKTPNGQVQAQAQAQMPLIVPQFFDQRVPYILVPQYPGYPYGLPQNAATTTATATAAPSSPPPPPNTPRASSAEIDMPAGPPGVYSAESPDSTKSVPPRKQQPPPPGIDLAQVEINRDKREIATKYAEKIDRLCKDLEDVHAAQSAFHSASRNYDIERTKPGTLFVTASTKIAEYRAKVAEIDKQIEELQKKRTTLTTHIRKMNNYSIKVVGKGDIEEGNKFVSALAERYKYVTQCKDYVQYYSARAGATYTNLFKQDFQYDLVPTTSAKKLRDTIDNIREQCTMTLVETLEIVYNRIVSATEAKAKFNTAAAPQAVASTPSASSSGPTAA